MYSSPDLQKSLKKPRFNQYTDLRYYPNQFYPQQNMYGNQQGMIPTVQPDDNTINALSQENFGAFLPFNNQQAPFQMNIPNPLFASPQHQNPNYMSQNQNPFNMPLTPQQIQQFQQYQQYQQQNQQNQQPFPGQGNP